MKLLQTYKECPVKKIAYAVVILGLCIGTLDYFATRGRQIWYVVYLRNYVFTVCCSFFCSWFLCGFYSRIKKFNRLFFCAAFIALVTFGVFLGVILATLILQQKFETDLQTYYKSLFFGIIASVLITGYVVLKENLEEKVMKLKEAELENERLKRYEVESRLNSLQAKLNPHFLFNTLNAAASLTQEDPLKAERNIVRLSELYRKVLSISEKTFIQIAEEIELIEDYLELEKMRFDEKLTYSIDCPANLKSRKIPGLLIEPLVENAIKHNLDKSGNALAISISFNEEGKNIFITVRDNGAGFDPEKTEWGFGLFSIQERLRLLFKENFKFEINPALQQGTTIVIKMPLESDI